MRTRFHGELEQLGIDLATMCGLAAEAMDHASRALLESDLRMAEQVISGDEQLDVLRDRCEKHSFRLLSLQAPVARDLRLVVTGIQAAEKIERMGDLARHIAEIARRRHPACAVPDPLADRSRHRGGLPRTATAVSLTGQPLSRMDVSVGNRMRCQ